jgi:amino acid transporter
MTVDTHPPISVATSGVQNSLRPARLGLPDVIAQSVAVIAPELCAGVVSYLAAVKAGGATPLAFLFAMLGTLCLGGVVSRFARTLPSAGSLYTYTTVGLSRLAGFVVGCLYAVTFIVIAGAALAGFGYFSSTLLRDVSSHRGHPTVVAWYWFFLAGLVVLAVSSLFDVRLATRSQLVFTAASVTIMLVAAAIVIGRGSPTGSANPGAHLDLGAFWPHAAGVPWTGVCTGFAFGMLSFVGFETAAVLSEETAAPRRNIPRAVLGSVLVVGVFYLVATYATAIGFGVRDARTAWPGAAAGLVAVTPYQWLGDLILFAIATSCLFCATGLHTAVSRTLYAMGRERVLPATLGRTHRRLRTPWSAIILSLTLIAAVVLGCLGLMSARTEAAVAAVPAESVDVNTGAIAAFSYLAGLGTPAVLVCYLLLGLAAVRAGRAAEDFRFIVLGLLAAATGAIGVYGSLYYSFVGGALFVNRLIPVLVAAAIATSIVAGVALRMRARARWEAMGLIFED